MNGFNSDELLGNGSFRICFVAVAMIGDFGPVFSALGPLGGGGRLIGVSCGLLSNAVGDVSPLPSPRWHSSYSSNASRFEDITNECECFSFPDEFVLFVFGTC